jgi:hypothetical protein
MGSAVGETQVENKFTRGVNMGEYIAPRQFSPKRILGTGTSLNG